MLKRSCKPIFLSLLSCCFLSLSLLSCSSSSNVETSTEESTNETTSATVNIAKGADIGWVSQLEDLGVTWVDDNKKTEDPLKLLKSKGIDSIRLRVFVDPPSNYTWTKNDGTVCYLGYGDKEHVVAMAKRAKELDMKVMIDFHYSDHFADPAYQDKPAAWEDHTFDELKEDVYNHTLDVMTALSDENIYPEWVQIGNEITSGMLWPDGNIWDGGKTPTVDNLTEFINKGSEAVKSVSPSSKIVIHLANGYDNDLFTNVFDALEDAKANYDVIGMSYYPYWEGSDYTETIDDLAANLNDMVSRYDKDVILCEIGGLEDEPTETYDLLKAAIDTVSNTTDGRGLGVFYWEPAANSSVLPDGYPLGACNEVSENVLQFTTALDAFK